MSNNAAMCRAKYEKDDEYYTCSCDIKEELAYYKDALAGKRVLCCFDAPDSEFARLFAQEYDTFGLAGFASIGRDGEGRLTASSRVGIAMSYRSVNNMDMYLEGFWTEWGMEMLDWCDIVITNPPFSRMRDFMKTVFQAKKQFLVIGMAHMLTYDDIFPELVAGNIHMGVTRPKGFMRPDGSYCHLSGACWLTNMIPVGAPQITPMQGRRQPYAQSGLRMYANYDALDVPGLAWIPEDYFGVMGVPASFLELYEPGDGQPDDGRVAGLSGPVGRWFDIIGLAPKCLPNDIVYGQEFLDRYRAGGGRAKISAGMKGLAYYDSEGHAKLPYRRVLIQRRFCPGVQLNPVTQKGEA